MKRRIWAAVLAAVCLFSLAGCRRGSNKNDGLRVICTVFPPYDFVRAIAPEAEVSLLLAPGQESHSYEPTPRDIIDIQTCDLFIYVGGESEAWVEDMLRSMENPPRTLTLLECVGMKDMHLHDEHVWTSPKHAVSIVERLENTLCELGVSNEDALRTAAKDYADKLKGLDTQFSEAANAAPRKTLVFGDRFPFRHFADTYALSCASVYEGCDHSAEPSAAAVAALTDRVKDESIPVVLYIEFSNQKLADTLCEATGAKKRLFHSCHNLTKAELESGETYLSLMTSNLAVLKEALYG